MTVKKSYELVTSKNKKFVAGVCRQKLINEMYEMRIWDGETMCPISVLFVDVDLGGERFAISDDGKFVATAKYEDYKDGKIHVYNVETGEIIFEKQSLARIQWLKFMDSNTLMVGTDNYSIFSYDIASGVCISKIKGKKIYFNKYGNDLLVLDNNKIKYGNNICKSSTFAYLCAIGIDGGILVSEVNGDLFCFDNDGKMCWKTNCLDWGHFTAVYYEERVNKIYGILLNPRKKGNERMHFVILDKEFGTIIEVDSIETANYVFVECSKYVLLINGKGGMYTFNNGLQRMTFIQ